MSEIRVASAEELVATVRESPELQAELKRDPVETLQRLAGPLERDPWIYRIVVLSLGLAILGVIAATLTLKLAGIQEVPDILAALGAGAIGAIAGLLSPFPARR